MTTTLTASPELPDLDQLEALARAATPGPWSWWASNSTLRLTGADGRDGGVLYGYVHSGDGDINCAPKDQAFIAAANPAAVLALIALARRAQHAETGAQAALPPLPTPARYDHVLAGKTGIGSAYTPHQMQEYARATLAAQSQGAQPNEFEVAIYDCALMLNLPRGAAAMDVCRAINRLATAAQQGAPAPRVIGGQPWSKEAEMTEGWLAAQQAAAPGSLDADEMTRLRRLIHALGMDGSTNASDNQVRGLLFTALGQAASKLERATSAPGTPEAPADAMAQFAAWKGYELPALNGEGHFDKDWLHREWRAFQAGMARAAQLDGGQGEKP